MKGKKAKSKQSDTMRKKAEEFVNKNPSYISKMQPKDVKALVEDLQIHQVELEMQNEELRRAQRELEEARDKYSELYDYAPVGYFTISDKGVILEGNLTGAAMLGVERMLLIGRPFSDFITRDDQDSFYLHRKRLFETKIRESCELRLAREDGTQFYGQLKSIVIKDDDGELTRFRGVLSHIDNLKRTVATIKESEEKFRSMFEDSALGKVLTDRDGRYLEVNRSMSQILGYTREELLSMTIRDISYSDEVVQRNDIVEKLWTGESNGFAMEKRYVHKDGHIVWGSITVSAIHDDRGKTIATMGQLLDITELKKAKEALRESQEVYRNIISESPVGISIYDASGQCMEANDSLAKIIGTTKEKVLQQNYNNIESWEESGFLEKAKSAVEQQSIKRHDLVVESTFGKEVKVDAYLVPFSSGGLLLMVNDNTERHKLEEERLKVEKLESLGILAGGLGHDFNNILTTIMGNISFVKMAMDPASEAYEALNDAETASHRAKSIIQQLMTLSMGGSLVKETASLPEVIRESSSFVLKGSNVRCNFTIPEDIWPTEIDVGQISQVIQNLIINADQAMPDGGVIKIEMENKIIWTKDALPLPSGKYVHVCVKDEGIGISTKHLPKLFDPYFSTKDKGSGLGLAMAHSIIKKHGGHIAVDSELGAGASFHFYLNASGGEIAKTGALERDLI